MFIIIKSDIVSIELIGEYQKIVKEVTGLKALVIPNGVKVNIIDLENKASIEL